MWLAFVFGPLACLEVPSGLNAASAYHGKTQLPSGLLETRDFPSFNATKICPSNKPKLGTKWQKKNKHHF